MLKLEVILFSFGFALIFAVSQERFFENVQRAMIFLLKNLIQKPHITEEQKNNFVKHVKSNDSEFSFQTAFQNVSNNLSFVYFTYLLF